MIGLRKMCGWYYSYSLTVSTVDATTKLANKSMSWSSLQKKKTETIVHPSHSKTPPYLVSTRRWGKDRPWPASCARFAIRSTPQQRSHARRFTNGKKRWTSRWYQHFSREKIVGKIGYPISIHAKVDNKRIHSNRSLQALHVYSGDYLHLMGTTRSFASEAT